LEEEPMLLDRSALERLPRAIDVVAPAGDDRFKLTGCGRRQHRVVAPRVENLFTCQLAARTGYNLLTMAVPRIGRCVMKSQNGCIGHRTDVPQPPAAIRTLPFPWWVP
jgi:hypothetical protein